MKILPDGKGQLSEEPEYLGPQTFREMACAAFPELAADPDIDLGVHLSMAALGKQLMSAVRAGDRARSATILAFLDGVLRTPRLHPEIANAVSVSFIVPEEVNATASGREMWSLAPEGVRALVEGNARSGHQDA